MSYIGKFFGKYIGRFLGDQGTSTAPVPKLGTSILLYSQKKDIEMHSQNKPIRMKEVKCL